MAVPVFKLPGTTSNMYFVHVNLMISVEKKQNTKMCKGPPQSIVGIPQNYLRLELSGHLNKTVKTPMPS